MILCAARTRSEGQRSPSVGLTVRDASGSIRPRPCSCRRRVRPPPQRRSAPVPSHPRPDSRLPPKPGLRTLTRRFGSIDRSARHSTARPAAVHPNRPRARLANRPQALPRTAPGSAARHGARSNPGQRSPHLLAAAATTPPGATLPVPEEGSKARSPLDAPDIGSPLPLLKPSGRRARPSVPSVSRAATTFGAAFLSGSIEWRYVRYPSIPAAQPSSAFVVWSHRTFDHSHDDREDGRLPRRVRADSGRSHCHLGGGWCVVVRATRRLWPPSGRSGRPLKYRARPRGRFVRGLRVRPAGRARLPVLRSAGEPVVERV